MKKKSDPLALHDNQELGLCGNLKVATLCTNSLNDIINFYVHGMGMTLSDPVVLSDLQEQNQRKLWDIPENLDYTMYHLHRASVPSLIHIRLLVFHQDIPAIHLSYSCLELGPFSLGFPNLNQKQLDKKLNGLDIQSMAPLQVGTITHKENTYEYYETIYKAPDYLHCVGIQRGNNMPQVTPCDENTQLGGPGYSAQVVQDGDVMFSFLTNVLDFEVRMDWHWQTSAGSALGVEEGTPYRLTVVYAKGTSQNYFLFLDFKNAEVNKPSTPPRIPNRGLAAWTIQTENIDEVYKRALNHGSKIISSPINYNSPILGDSIFMSILAPNGFLIEVFQNV